MLLSERAETSEAFGPTLVVSPMSVTQQWSREIARFAPGPPRPPPPRAVPPLRALPSGTRLARATSSSRRTTSRRGTSTCSPAIEWDRLLLDEAQDAKNPRTKRHRALRRIPRQAHAGPHGHADREPARRALVDHGSRQPRPARHARGVRADPREADRGAPRRPRARAAALARRPVRPPPCEGRTGGRSRAASDHDHEGPVPPDGRAGEPLPGDRRPLDAADRAPRAQVRSPWRRPRDARPAEAALQPSRDRPADRRAARRALGQARTADRAARGRPRRRQGARLHAVPRLRPARAAPGDAARPRGRVLPRRPVRAVRATSSSRGSSPRTARPCSSSRSARAGAA